ASCPGRSPRRAMRSVRLAPARAFRAGDGAASSLSNQTIAGRLRGGRSEVVSSLAPALLLFRVEVARCRLGLAAGAIGTAAHYQPDQNDQQDRRADNVDDPPLRDVHVPLLPWELSGCSPYIAPMARLGSWIESHPEGIYVRPADAWIDPSQPKPKAM